MKLKYTFDTMQLEDSIIAVPVNALNDGFRGVVKLNETAAAIFELLSRDITEDEIVEALLKEYDAPRETVSKAVHKCIIGFEEKGLLA
jgi:hypothetical protein